MSRAALLLGALASGARALSGAAGVCGALTQAGLNTALTSLIPVVENITETITLPAIPIHENFGVGDVSGTISNVHATSVRIGTLSAAVDADRLSVHAAGVSLTAAGTSALDITIVFVHSHCNGPVTVSASSASLDFSVALSADAAGRAVLSAPDAVRVDLGGLDVHFGCGGFDGDLLNDVIKLFSSLLASTVQATAQALVAAALADAQRLIDALPLALPLPLPAPFNDTALRLGIVGQPAYRAGVALEACVQGDAAPTSWPPGQPLPLAPPALPSVANATGGARAAAALVSDYSAASLTWALFSQTPRGLVLPPADVPPPLNETSGWALLAPGLAAAFPGGGVGVAIAVVGTPAAVLNGTGATGDGHAALGAALAVAVDVYDGAAIANASVLVLDVNVSFLVDLGWPPGPDGFTNFSAAFHNVSTTAAVASSAVGPVPGAALVAALVADAINAILPAVNAATARGFVFGIPGLFALANADFAQSTNYLQLATDVVLGPFAPPP